MFLANVCATTLIAIDGQRTVLVSAHDAMGAAIAAAIGETFLALISVMALARRGHRAVPPTTWILRLALAAALGIGTELVVPLPQLAAAVVGTLVFVARVLGLRLTPPELADSLTPRRWMSG